MPTWDDAQYLQFADQRNRAVHELLGRVQLQLPQRIVDLGCGPGNSTALLQQRWPQARITGIDNSPEMLRRARSDHPNIEFIAGDVSNYVSEGNVALAFANAVLHWVPQHETLFPRLLSLVAAGGALAVQMPDNGSEPSHALMPDPAPGWAKYFAKLEPRTPLLSAARYYDLLAPHCRYVDIWRTTYEQVMPDVEAIVAWVAGSGLRPYLDALPPARRPDYLADYASALSKVYPTRTDGRRLFSFPRLFIIAQR